MNLLAYSFAEIFFRCFHQPSVFYNVCVLRFLSCLLAFLLHSAVRTYTQMLLENVQQLNDEQVSDTVIADVG